MYPATHQCAPGAWEKEKVKTLLKKFEFPRESAEELISKMNEDFSYGLKNGGDYHSPVKMLLTYVHGLPDGTETGDYFALDLGGTNFRVLLVKLHDGNVSMSHETFPISQEIMKGDADGLFGYIAECLAKFAKLKLGQETRKLGTVGFTFSFPVRQESLTCGALIKWTKGFDVDDVEDHDVVALLQQAIEKRNEIEVEQIALLNDTTGVMMSCAYNDPDVMVGMILGTGSNACYMEKLEYVGKWFHPQSPYKECIINTEWGAYGDMDELQSVSTSYDKIVDEESLYPGKQLFEKMISGMYLGEIVRQCILSLIKDFVLFRGYISPQLGKKDSFTTIYVSEFCSGDAMKCVNILHQLGYEAATIEDCHVMQDICIAVSLRAARLAAAGLTCILRRLKRSSVSVAMDGSLYKKHPTFKRFMHQALEEFLPTTHVNLRLAEDGSGRGAAVVAAVAQRLAKAALVD